jgi:hypothetical protein
MELPFDPRVWIPSECPSLLAGLDKNAQRNAGSQSNSSANLLCGHNIPWHYNADYTGLYHTVIF